VSVLVEMVVDRAVDGGEFLQTSHPPELEHGPFPSSEGLVGTEGPRSEFSTRLFNHRPVSRFLIAPKALRAAP
jgi:hypothetical protein